MRTVYPGSWSYRLNIILPTLSGFGCTYFFLYAPIQRTLIQHQLPNSILIATVPVGILALMAGIGGVVSILESFSHYSVDDQGIEKAGPLQRWSLPWSAVTSIRYAKALSRKALLTDHNGKIHTVCLELVSRGSELETSIDQHLAELIERQKRDALSGDRTFYAGRPACYALGFLGFMGLIAAIGAPAMIAGGVAGGALWITALCLAMALPIFGYAVRLYSWQIYAHEHEVGSRTVFGTTVIPYSQVSMVAVRDVNAKNGAINTTTVYSDKAKITFSSAMPNYELLRDFVLQHIDPEALKRGTEATPSIEKREIKQAIAMLAVISLGGFGSLSLVLMNEMRNTLKIEDQLDREGRTTAGMVTGTHESGSKSTRYFVDYSYQVGNRTFTRFSQVSQERYSGLVTGQPIEVTYLPETPGTARASISIGRSAAQNRLNGSYAMLAFAAVIPVIMYFVLLADAAAKRRRAANR